MLLNEPKRRWTLSELATTSGVSLGMVHRVMKRLENEGFVDRTTRGSAYLVDQGGLLDAWSDRYQYKDHTIAGYHCSIEDQNDVLGLLRNGVPDQEYALTLGAGVSQVAPLVRSSDVYVYVRDDGKEIIRALDLTPVEFGGNVHLMTPNDTGVFIETQRINGMTVVSNIQLYLDLYRYPMRGKEQAAHLREKILEI